MKYIHSVLLLLKQTEIPQSFRYFVLLLILCSSVFSQLYYCIVAFQDESLLQWCQTCSLEARTAPQKGLVHSTRWLSKATRFHYNAVFLCMATASWLHTEHVWKVRRIFSSGTEVWINNVSKLWTSWMWGKHPLFRGGDAVCRLLLRAWMWSTDCKTTQAGHLVSPSWVLTPQISRWWRRATSKNTEADAAAVWGRRGEDASLQWTLMSSALRQQLIVLLISKLLLHPSVLFFYCLFSLSPPSCVFTLISSSPPLFPPSSFFISFHSCPLSPLCLLLPLFFSSSLISL